MDRLSNDVRPYAWGSTTAIPALLGIEPTGEPQAELWMGAHPGAPSRIDRGAGPVALCDVIAADPEGELGRAALERFGPRLPFLLKVLAVASPLSLQVHPDLEQAREGFRAEEERGVPVDAPHRNYKDANHKPELLCALEPFDGLCGFRAARETADLLERLDVGSLKPYVDILRARPQSHALREVLTAVLTAEKGPIAETVDEAARAAERLAAAPGPFSSAYAAYAAIARNYPGDSGVLAAMLLNHVHLRPGEALYLKAGVPHAYLRGTGVELMANSDNVLRCGLTPKHVDVPELLRIVDFRSSEPGVLRPTPGGEGAGRAGGEERYPVPIDEFRLSRFVVHDGAEPVALEARTAQVVLCTAGMVRLTRSGGPAETLMLSRGESAYVPAEEAVTLAGAGTAFRATAAP